jgi:hypothetical protein
MLNKEEIFEVLNDWNFWNRSLPVTISRIDYEKEIARKAKSRCSSANTLIMF